MAGSLAQRQTQQKPGARGRGGSKPASASQVAAPAVEAPKTQGAAVDLQAALGNSAVATALAPAKADKGPAVDLFGAAMAGKEDPNKYKFAEGPEDKVAAPSNDGRMNQKAGLPALREKHAGSPYEDFKKGTSFVQGAGDKAAVDPNDVRQGGLGDCYLMAGMAGVARANPDAIQKLIKDNKDGTFDVTLYLRKSPYSRPTPVTKTIDARLPVKGPGSTTPLYANTGDVGADGQTELWSALIEKTVAQHKQSYDKISGGNIAKDGFNFAGATELLTGKNESYQATDSMAGDDILLTIAAALEAKKPITVDSRDLATDPALTQQANAKNVYWNHAYAPVSVDMDKGTINLQNPWGSNHVDNLSVEDFKKFYRSIRVNG